MTLLDSFLPEFQISERHEIVVRASLEDVYSVVRSLNLGASPAIRWLFRLRGLPPSALTLEGLQRMRFVVLGEVLNQELLLGLIGRFWTLTGDLQRVDARSFRAFDRAGLARAAWNFTLEVQPDGAVLVATETRVQPLDERSAKRFRRYWRVIGPFSAWIRMEALRMIRREAERRQPPRAHPR